MGYIFLRGILPNTYCDRITQGWVTRTLATKAAGSKGWRETRMTRVETERQDPRNEPHSSINAVAIRLYSFVEQIT